jgi:uncharacterized protein (DUF2141 family)
VVTRFTEECLDGERMYDPRRIAHRMLIQSALWFPDDPPRMGEPGIIAVIEPCNPRLLSAVHSRCQAMRGYTNLRLLVLVLWLGWPSPTVAQDQDLLELFDALESAPPTTGAPLPHAPSATAGAGLVTVQMQVDGVRNDRGLVHVLLYDEADAYTAGDAPRAAGYGVVPAAAGRVILQVKAAGNAPYAAFAYHDENANNHFEQRGGRPLEGYGFSGGVDYEPPPFARAAQVSGAGAVRLLYLDTRRR